MKGVLADILASFVTFTRLPIPWHLSDESFGKATWHIPAVAWLSATLIAVFLSSQWGPADFRILVILFLPMILSGGMHEDGLADSADGFFGGHTVLRRLAIMKDSSSGVFAILALIASVMGSYLAFKNIPEKDWIAAVFISLPLSRLAGPLLATVLPYVRAEESKAKAFLGGSRLNFLWSIFWILPLAAFYDEPRLPFALLGFTLAVIAAGLLCYKKIGGITGDTLGAAIKITELAVLWSLAWGRGL